MSVSTDVGGSAGADAAFDVNSPITGERLATLPVHSEEDVRAAVSRARAASYNWSALTHAERREYILDFRREIVRRMDDFIDTVHKENGKPRIDAAAELLLVVTHLTHAANRAEKVFESRTVGGGMQFNQRCTISYHPLGVVGVIGPWNYPIFTPIGAMAYALAAGNTVVLKPSELTPLSGQLLGECARAAIPIPDVVQVVTGYGETGAALAGSDVDKISFTGSTATGRRVMSAASQNLTPVILELGGKDPMIVTADADIEDAAKTAAFGGLTNAGQACISVERIYVDDSVHDRFVEALVKQASRVAVGGDDESLIGPMTMERQIGIVRRHVEDALEKGARAVFGGLDSFKGRFIHPIVLADVTPEMAIHKEETFGPVLPVVRVPNVEEAIRLANDTEYGLGSSVFAGKDGEAIARQIRAGMTAVNSVIVPTAIGSMPFGGVGDSGFGRIHGDEGLLEFVRAKSTTVKRFEVPGMGIGFQSPKKGLPVLKDLLKRVYGGTGVDQFSAILGRIRR